jgi:hypothetical protein
VTTVHLVNYSRNVTTVNTSSGDYSTSSGLKQKHLAVTTVQTTIRHPVVAAAETSSGDYSTGI